MKILILLVAFYSVQPAQGAEYKIFDVTNKFAHSGITSEKFVVNQDLGRSWIEVTVSRGSYDDSSDMDDRYKVKLPGLSYDKASEAVILESEGQIVECARFVTRGRSIFKRRTLELTQRCRFEHRNISKIVDDGFYETEEKRLQAFLIVE